jgi:hypothetical protein
MSPAFFTNATYAMRSLYDSYYVVTSRGRFSFELLEQHHSLVHAQMQNNRFVGHADTGRVNFDTAVLS